MGRGWHLLRMVLEGRVPLREASDWMEISYRHKKCLKHVIAWDAPRGLVHGNMARRPANAVNLYEGRGQKGLNLFLTHSLIMVAYVATLSPTKVLVEMEVLCR